MSPLSSPTTQGERPFTFAWAEPKMTPREMRELRKREKRAAKEARATRALDPEHVAAKTEMIQKAESSEQSVRDAAPVGWEY